MFAIFEELGDGGGGMVRGLGGLRAGLFCACGEFGGAIGGFCW